ncbi:MULTISPECIES: TPM domain-containing protein [unclassified Microcystis]|uniref:TPM domain-containing protein n=1 Tax=unclassified Microcystis TaxID=2643300 RepID=UPI00257F6EF6|nr:MULTISPECIES: TPM domain-containing protein [unclassified Microcystis]
MGLILVSLKDRRIEIETGYGVQRFLPDAQVKDIIYTYMTPSFKTGNYEEGIRAGVTVVSGFLRSAYGLRQTEFKPQIAISILHLVLAILMVGVSFPLMLILYFVYFRCAVGGSGRGGSGGGSSGNSDYCGYDGYGGGGYDGGGFGGGSSDGGGGGGGW